MKITHPKPFRAARRKGPTHELSGRRVEICGLFNIRHPREQKRLGLQSPLSVVNAARNSLTGTSWEDPSGALTETGRSLLLAGTKSSFDMFPVNSVEPDNGVALRSKACQQGI